MKPTRTLIIVALGVASVVCLAPLAPAGQWIAADQPAGLDKPAFAPVPLFWFRVVRNPCLYRKVIEVPTGATRATALLRTSGYVYVWVDGRQVYAWGQQKDSPEQAVIPGEPERIHELDLGEQLTPGKHVLVVSAPPGHGQAGGFVLDGGFYQYEKDDRLAPLASDESWSATIFRPTEIVEDDAIMTPAYDGKQRPGICSAASKVKAVGEPWQAGEDALAAAYFRGWVRFRQRELAEATWRLELLAKKGLYLDGNSAACGWGGPARPQVVGQVLRAMVALDKGKGLAKSVAAFPRDALEDGKPVASAEALRGLAKEMAGIHDECLMVCDQVGLAGESANKDETLALKLASSDSRASTVSPATGETLRRALTAAFGLPPNRLNESRHDRLGWLPLPALTDSDLGGWGVRVNPVTGPTSFRLPFRWRFSMDPQDVGLKELRQTIGYNIESQWPTVDGQQSWTADKNFKDYKGIAWYRTRVALPAEWAGSDVTMAMRIAGKARVWINDQEITDRRGRGIPLGGPKGLPRVRSGGGADDAGGPDDWAFVIPAAMLLFGAENFLSLRVEADGPARGLVAPTDVSCPALEGPAGKATPAVDVLATPLSPCVVLMPRTGAMHIHHAGKAGLVLPGGKAAGGYDAAKDGKLPANWAMLWLTPAAASAVERPILLVFNCIPTSIACEQGVTKVTFPAASGDADSAGAGAAAPAPRVIAVRPWAKAVPKQDAPAIAAKAAFWSRAALAVPINYMNITAVLKKGEPWENTTVDAVPAGPVLGQTVIYDYLTTADAWGTQPLKLAPLPALCSMALDSKFRGLKVDAAEKLETLHDGGIAAAYLAVQGTDRVSYSYPVEPWPRLVGFTSYMFSGADVGVPGNKREMEIIAATGANSYRPQNNFAAELALMGVPGEKRTRIQVLADLCRDNGVNFMNNIDETLGQEPMVRNEYDKWVRTILYPHYDKLVPQLADRPFWQAAFDLVNEPFHHKAAAYNAVMKELTARIRKQDRRHLLYIEPCQAWGAIQQLALIEPTGDPLTMYSFHDYNFKVTKAEDRWPTADRDISAICRMWWPAFQFAIRHGTGMHCGEFGDFGAASDDSPAQTLLLNDFYRIFDQFGMHHHYYSGRGVYQRQLDGSLRPSNVVRAFRAYMRRGDVNFPYKMWEGCPKPVGP
jgi:hypothetical protein